jgi:hypothetical protein
MWYDRATALRPQPPRVLLGISAPDGHARIASIAAWRVVQDVRERGEGDDLDSSTTRAGCAN